MNTTTPDRTLDQHVARFLAAIYGPLGPVAGMAAYEAALDRMEVLAMNTPSGHDVPTITESAFRQIFDREDIADYLVGLSRAEVARDLNDYVQRNR